MSVRKSAALVLAQLCIGAFFLSGVIREAFGDSAGWFATAGVVLAVFARSIDVESWALLIPGGLPNRVKAAFGERAMIAASAAALVERLVLGALASVVIGHYIANGLAAGLAGRHLAASVRPEDFATIGAIGAIGFIWIRTRIGMDLSRDTLARAVWIGVAVVVTAVVWAVGTVAVERVPLSMLAVRPPEI
jgi:hypothetical protein